MRLAIITPGFSPVPDTKGAAVEMLVGFLIDCNETRKICDIDLYTLKPDIIPTYRETNVITIKENKIEKFFSKILNHFYLKLSLEKHSNPYINKSIKQLKNKKYDYMLIENNVYAYEAIYKEFGNSTKLIFHLHNDIGGLDKPISLCKLIAQTSYRTIAVSNFIKRRFEESTGGKAHVLYNCIDEQSYDVIDDRFINCIKQKFCLDIKRKTFIYIGRLQKEKGVLELIKAFSKSKILCKQAQLLVVGSIWYGKKNKSDYYNEIKKYVQRSKNIFLIGGIDHNKISSILELADVCVIPTLCEEAFGLVALEAMVKKKALIVTNSGGLTEVIDSSTPIIKRDKDIIKHLANIMEEYSLKSDEELLVLGDKQFKRYKSIEGFSNRKYLDRLMKIIKS